MSQDQALTHEDDFIDRWNKLNENWASTFKYYQESDKFLTEYFRNSLFNSAKLIDDLNTFAITEKNNINAKVAETRDLASKDQQNTNNALKDINDLTEKLVQNVKQLDVIKGQASKNLFGLTAKGVSGIPVNDAPVAKDLFAFLTGLFYKDGKKFDWSAFTKEFSADKGDKFVIACASLNFGFINDQQWAELNRIKSDQKLVGLKGKNDSVKILLAYLDHLTSAIEVQRAIDDLERRIKKLKVESEFSQVRAQPLNDKANKLAADQGFVDEVQNKFANASATVREALMSMNQEVDDYRNHRNGVYTAVFAKYNEIQGVPAKIYL